MPLKKSKTIVTQGYSPWRVESDCSELQLTQLAKSWLNFVGQIDRVWVFLQGPLGAGKSTLMQIFLKQVLLDRSFEGSPTFPLVHEYLLPDGRQWIHMDLYRIKSMEELEERGVFSYLWERPQAWVFIEWPELFPEFIKLLENKKPASVQLWKWELQLKSETTRDIRLSRFVF